MLIFQHHTRRNRKLVEPRVTLGCATPNPGKHCAKFFRRMAKHELGWLFFCNQDTLYSALPDVGGNLADSPFVRRPLKSADDVDRPTSMERLYNYKPNHEDVQDRKPLRWVWAVTIAIPTLITILGLIMIFYLNFLQGR